MNRRSFLKGLVGVAAGLVLPPVPEQRFWQLDRTMVHQFERFYPALDPSRTPLTSRLPNNHNLFWVSGASDDGIVIHQFSSGGRITVPKEVSFSLDTHGRRSLLQAGDVFALDPFNGINLVGVTEREMPDTPVDPAEARKYRIRNG